MAGIWAYYKFPRGRTFKPRAEVDIAASIVDGEADKAISLSVSFHNSGLIRIKLPSDVDAPRVVQVWGTEDATPGSNPYWGDQLILADLLEGHDGCEVGETLLDHLLLPVPVACGELSRPWLAFRIEVLIVSRKRKGPKGRPRPWRATTLLTEALTESVSDQTETEGSKYGTAAALRWHHGRGVRGRRGERSSAEAT